MEIGVLAREIDSMPEISQLVDADDPEVVRQTLELIGYPKLASQNVQLMVIRRHFDSLGTESPAYHWFYRKVIRDGQNIFIPRDVIAQLRVVAEKKAFKRVIFRSTEDNQQFVAIGIFESEGVEEEYGVSHWSKSILTPWGEIPELKRIADKEAKYLQDKEEATERARKSRERFFRRFTRPAEVAWHYRESVVLALSIGTMALSIDGSAWWLFGGLSTIFSMISIIGRRKSLRSMRIIYRDEHTFSREGVTDPVKAVTWWFIGAAMAMFTAVGILSLVNWNETVRTGEALVCSVNLKHTWGYPTTASFTGPQGTFQLQSSTIDNVYYPNSEAASKALHKGQTLEVTYKGGRAGNAYLLKATTVANSSLGTCAG